MKRSLCLLALVGVASVARADVVLDWNSILLDTIRATGTNPPRASRAMAMVHAAVFDAVNGIEGGYAPYLVTAEPSPNASPVAAAAVAAHDVLAALYPARTSIFDA